MAKRPAEDDPSRADLLEAYGQDVLTEKGRKQYMASVSPWPNLDPWKDVDSAAMYGDICRRLAFKQGGVMVGSVLMDLDGPSRIDGRLVAVGFNHVKPRQWIGEHMLGSFVSWWNKSQEAPFQVGSQLNADPKVAFKIWMQIREGGRLAKPLLRAISAIPSRHWYRLVSRREGPPKLAWDIVEQAPEIGRAIRRFQAKDLPLLADIDNRTLFVLGSHGPGAQLDAVERLKKQREGEAESVTGIVDPFVRRAKPAVVRVGDLPLATMKSIEKATSASPRADLAYAYRKEGAEGRRFAALVKKLDPKGEGASKILAPSYPNVPTDLAVKIAKGMTPVEASMGILDRKEAHEWLSSSVGPRGRFLQPLEWLQTKLPAGTPAVRSALITRWLLDVQKRGGWGQLTKERIEHGPNHAEIRYRRIDRIDEVGDDELVEGSKTNVDVAFKRVDENAMKELLSKHEVLLKLDWPIYPKHMRILDTAALMAREGLEMEHCAGRKAYVDSAKKRQSVLVSFNVKGERATAELEVVPKGGRPPRVIQLKGVGNRHPPPIAEKLFKFWIRKVFKTPKDWEIDNY